MSQLAALAAGDALAAMLVQAASASLAASAALEAPAAEALTFTSIRELKGLTKVGTRDPEK